MKLEHFKAFNAEHAKAGAPYCQRNGLAARIGIWDSKGDFRLVGVREYDDGSIEQSCSWTNSGKSMSGSFHHELVMLPLGYCEGKPVFVGDELVSFLGKLCTIKPMESNKAIEASKWPRTAPVMPRSTLSNFASVGYRDGNEFVQDILINHRKEIEAYWKALDEFNGVKA